MTQYTPTLKRALLLILSVGLFAMASCTNEGVVKKQQPSQESGIEGRWRFPDDEFVSIIISRDTMNYIDQRVAVAYRQLGDVLIIKDDGFNDTVRYKMLGTDTLIFFFYDGDAGQMHVRNARD